MTISKNNSPNTLMQKTNLTSFFRIVPALWPFRMIGFLLTQLPLASFWTLCMTPIIDHYNTQSILMAASAFIYTHGGQGDIVLITNAIDINFWNDEQIANTILQGINPQNIHVHVVNYKVHDFTYEWSGVNEQLTYAQKYFYEILTSETSGHLFGSLEGAFSVWESIDNVFRKLKEKTYIYDLYPSSANGFTYERYYQNYFGQSQNINSPIIQIGKYVGDFPEEFDFFALADTNIIIDHHIIDNNTIEEGDTTVRESWVGNHLRFLEGLASGNDDFLDIIDISKAERVLSKYTAFLALDLEQGGEPCGNCWSYQELTVNTEEDQTEKFSPMQITVWPNPFVHECTISIEGIEEEAQGKISVNIFDNFGKHIFTFDSSQAINANSLLFTWDGKDHSRRMLPSGVYQLVVQGQGFRLAEKLVIMR